MLRKDRSLSRRQAREHAEDDKSKIVKTFAMQALADLAEEEPDLRAQFVELLEEWLQTGSPATQSRGRKLLQRLKQ